MGAQPNRVVRTPLLEIGYEDGGPQQGPPVVLLHGWPDDVRTYDEIVPSLHAAGFRTLVPWLRGFGPTRFLSESTPRSGQIAAMAQDALDFMDALDIRRCPVIGHDWGARIAYFLAAVEPGRLSRMVTMSLGWEPGEMRTPSLTQTRRFWYQWFMATERGARVVREDGIAFARFQWETWSPDRWFDERTFAATARSFENPDWPAITLHSYRVRWEQAEPDPRYTELERRQKAARSIAVPTLLVHGGADQCVGPETSENKDRYFTSGYARHVIPGVGHFPARESAKAVSDLIVPFLQAEGR